MTKNLGGQYNDNRFGGPHQLPRMVFLCELTNRKGNQRFEISVGDKDPHSNMTAGGTYVLISAI